jgi:hypothetical protein
MSELYSEDVVQDFIEDYEDEYGVTVPQDDAFLMLSLFDSLCVLLERYEGDDGKGDCLPLRMISTLTRR